MSSVASSRSRGPVVRGSIWSVLVATSLLPAAPAGAELISGTYVGDNTPGRAITGVGFAPDVVIVKNDAGRRAVASTSSILAAGCGGFCTKQLTGTATLRDVRILSLDADGFTVGDDPDVNGPGSPSYYWVAVKAVAGKIAVGSYLGDGADDRSITGLGFQPDYVITLPEGASACFQRSSAMAGDVSYDFETVTSVTDHIQVLQADGFQVGTAAAVNGAGVRIHYVAWKAVAGEMAVGSFVGNGADPRSIPVGFHPSWVIEKRIAACVPAGNCAAAVQKFASTGNTTDATLHFTSLGISTNHIQALEANGFQVGSDPRVNDVGGGTFHWMAFGSVPTEVELMGFSAVPLDGAVDLAWATGSELSNLGFHVYRSSGAEGPWARITSSLIPGLGSSPVGASYRYRDGGLANGTTYHYLLEDVETTGRTERHGPVGATPEAGLSNGGSGLGESGSSEGEGRITYGDPAGASLRVVERGPAHVVLELLTPGFTASTEAEGLVRVAIPGFEDPAVAGALSIPVRRALVEALAGRRVRLASVKAEDVVSFDGLRLSAAGAREVEVSAEGTVRTGISPRRLLEMNRRGGLTPRLWARLVGSLFQGETKKAQLELSPLRHDPLSGRTVLARRLTVRVEFFGVEGGERSLGGARGRRPRVLPGTSGVVAHLTAHDPGLYVVRFEDVFAPGQRGVLARRLRLSRLERPVAYHLEPDRALFAPGSRLFFVSEGADLNPRSDAVYELSLGRAATRMSVRSAPPSGSSLTEYRKTSRFEQNRFYQSALLGAPDLWLWDLLVSPVTKTYSFTVDALSSTSTSSRLVVVLQGASDFPEVEDHHLRLALNGIPVAEATWDGRVDETIEADVSPGVLVEGANTLSLENVGVAGASTSMVFLNRFEISYPRLLSAENGTLQGRLDQSGRLEISGLAGPAFVVDDTASPVWLQNTIATPTGLSFRGEEGESYLAVSESALKIPRVDKAVSRHLKVTAHRADWILISPREFLKAAVPLRDLRRRQELLPKLVALEDVYSEFGFGEARPEAIRDFLSFAFHNWKTRPRYVVLLGDSTYDPKDYLGTHVQDRIPSPLVQTSYLWTVSDPSLAAVNGDDLVPDLAIGRLSAGTYAEAERLVSKLVAFEEAGRTLDGKAVLVADNADLAGNFENDQDLLAQTVLAHREVEKIYLRDLGAATRTTIKAALDSGPALVSYVGHGSTVVWASENVWNNNDLASLDPQPQQPLLVTLNCLNGFFHFPPLDSLAEAFVKAEHKGAIAAFSPSGLSVNDAAHLYHQALLLHLLSPQNHRIGDALFAAQRTYADSGAMPELLSIYHLFGDPAMPIRP